jgi:FxsC-like protein
VPHFFFSYSREDAVDPYLYRFYDDLCIELSIRGGLDRASVGFIDREQPAGAEWPRTTGDALEICAVFVPVYSPHYFGSHACGQEWHAFSARMAAHRELTGRAPESIVPVWWVPIIGDLPPVAQHLQDTRDQFDSEYRKYREFGLRYLLQLKENESRYREFLVQFTTSILAAAADPPSPQAVPDLLSEPNAFVPGHGEIRRTQNLSEARGGGPRQVTFVVAAGSREEMRVIRTMLDVYGDDWADWRPYHPASLDRLVVRAQGVATAQRMISGLMPADDSTFAVLDRARERKELVVLIVDPWAIGLPAYERLLTRLDRVRSGNTAVLVPWEALEVLESPEGRHIRNKLHASLGNWVDAGEQVFREGMRSMEEFEKILGQVLVDIQARIISRAEVTRRVAEGGPRSRPILTGPGS